MSHLKIIAGPIELRQSLLEVIGEKRARLLRTARHTHDLGSRRIPIRIKLKI